MTHLRDEPYKDRFRIFVQFPTAPHPITRQVDITDWDEDSPVYTQMRHTAQRVIGLVPEPGDETIVTLDIPGAFMRHVHPYWTVREFKDFHSSMQVISGRPNIELTYLLDFVHLLDADQAPANIQ